MGYMVKKKMILTWEYSLDPAKEPPVNNFGEEIIPWEFIKLCMQLHHAYGLDGEYSPPVVQFENDGSK